MRILVGAAALMLISCASNLDTPIGRQGAPEWPFPVARGSALAPPAAAAASGQAAPPEGRAPGGVDFAAWRSADPASYAPAFQEQMRARLAGKGRAAAEADLSANGFACETGGALDCRIEIMERQCAFDWYVVREHDGEAPAAGFEVMCLGAN
jgi:hypothetical protein